MSPRQPLPDGHLLIGRREHVSFPAWGLARVRAKVDTGAYSSALDVAGYALLETPGGLVARLTLAPYRRHPERVMVVEAPVARMVRVACSSGKRQLRPLLEVDVVLGPLTRRIRLTVADRAGLRTPMLLGRQALAGTFLVDVGRKYLLRSS
jgi:hypothetical protein